MQSLAPLANTILIVVALVTIRYLGSCAIWPFTTCRRCDGHGRIGGPLGGIRLCPRCDATGLRLRLGRRAWNALRRLYRDITDHQNR